MKKRKLHFNKLIGLFITFTMLLFLSGNTFAQKKQIKNVIDKNIVQKTRTIDKLKTSKLFTKADRESRTIKPNNSVSNKAAMLYEGFDGGVFPPAGWTIDVISGAPSNLVLDTDYPLVGTGSAYWIGYNGGYTSPQESRLISPMVNVAIPAILTYNEWAANVGYNEIYVEISEDGTNWTTIYTPTGEWENNIVIPESYYGKNVYFAFHYIDTDPYGYGQPLTYWEIDEISLHGFTGTELLDLSFGDDQQGASTVDAVNHIVTSNVYQSTDLTSLAPDFTLSVGAQLSPTAEWYDGEGDIIPHDFTDTVEVGVLSGDGEHHQLWKIKADKLDTLYVGNELSKFNFGPYQVGEVWYDNYARRVEAKVLFDSTLIIAPTFEYSEKATVTPALGDTVDFTNPVYYTVVSESKDTVTWRVTVTNAAAEQDADIKTFSVDNQVGDATIEDGKVLAYVNNDKPLNSLNVDITVSPFATMVSPTTADFEAGPVIYKVVAEDDTVSIDWSVRLVYEDTLKPVVTPMYTNLDTLTNVGDSTQIKINESPSKVALVGEGHSFIDKAPQSLDDLVDNNEAVYVEIAKGDSIGTLFTEGLEVGNYLAYGIDSTGNISVAEDTLVIVIGTKEVATIADLWEDDLDDINYNMQYKITGEAVISFMQDYRNQKWIQDETAGIQVDDPEGIITSSYAQYDGMTGLTGTLKDYYGTLEIIPVEDPDTASSHNNTIEPKVINLEALNDNQQDYQSQLIKINNVDITSTGTFANGHNYDIQDYTSEGVLRSNFYDVDYIGTTIPDTVVNLVGIALWHYGEAKIAPRDLADFTGVEDSKFFAEDYDFEEVLVGDTVSEELYFGNIGNDTIVFDSVKLVGDAVFSLVEAAGNVSTLLSYVPDTVEITFTPDSAKTETALVLYYYDEDQIDTTVITGTGYTNPVWAVGSSENFEKEGYEEGDEYTGDDLPAFPPAGWHHQEYDPYVGSGYEWSQWWSASEAHSGEISACLEYGIGSFETPEIDLTGDDVKFPAIEFYNANYFGNYDDIYVGVSTDNTLPMEEWDRYEIKDIPVLDEGGTFAKNTVQLSQYKGESVWVRFYAERTSGLYLYEFIDDVSIIEFPVTPVFAVSADPVEFGATNTDVAVKQSFKINNEGISYITIEDVTVIGTDASLFTIPEDLTFGEESYDASVMSFDITFNPTTIGKKTAQLVIKHADAKNANLIDTVELVGYGVNCEGALEAVVGTNNAPYAPSWYKFTPEKNCVVSVLANTSEDTYLKVYDACGGTMISDNDDVRGTSHEVNADFDAASAADFFGEAGHTYYINWTEEWGGNGPFDFSLTVNEEEGAICETAKEVTLPMFGDTTFTGSTALTGDFYDDDPDLCNAHYLGGNDFVYTFTIDQAVLLSGSIDNDYAGMHIVTKPTDLFGAATESNATCAAFAYYDTKSHPFSNKRLEAGTYYVIVSTWPKPQVVDFTIHLTTKDVPRANVVFNVDMTYAVKRGEFDATNDFMDVAGTINGWAGSDHMTDADADGIYTITYNDLVIGETIEYKYRINGDWATSEFPNGGPNRTYTVLEGDNILNDVYDDNTDTVGVNELSLVERIEVYPNPNTGIFTISIKSNNSENIVVELVNIQGQHVYRKEINNVTNSVENIDISQFAKGIYYIKVNNGTDVAIRKVVVQ